MLAVLHTTAARPGRRQGMRTLPPKHLPLLSKTHTLLSRTVAGAAECLGGPGPRPVWQFCHAKIGGGRCSTSITKRVSLHAVLVPQLASPARQRKLIDFYLPYLPTLRRAVFGKHIATCIEKLHHRREQDASAPGGADSLVEAVQGLALAPADERPAP